MGFGDDDEEELGHDPSDDDREAAPGADPPDDPDALAADPPGQGDTPEGADDTDDELTTLRREKRQLETRLGRMERTLERRYSAPAPPAPDDDDDDKDTEEEATLIAELVETGLPEEQARRLIRVSSKRAQRTAERTAAATLQTMTVLQRLNQAFGATYPELSKHSATVQRNVRDFMGDPARCRGRGLADCLPEIAEECFDELGLKFPADRKLSLDGNAPPEKKPAPRVVATRRARDAHTAPGGGTRVRTPEKPAAPKLSAEERYDLGIVKRQQTRLLTGGSLKNVRTPRA